MSYELTDVEMELMKRIGYSDKAIKLFNEKINQGTLARALRIR